MGYKVTGNDYKEGSSLTIKVLRTSLAVRWSGLCTSTAEGKGLIPDQRTKIPHAIYGVAKKLKFKLSSSTNERYTGIPTLKTSLLCAR